MRYPADHKARAREALLRAGARSLKTSGFNGVGVDGLAAAAGVTSGAFYSNFPSKQAIVLTLYDELSADGVTPRPHWGHLIESLREIGPEELGRR